MGGILFLLPALFTIFFSFLIIRASAIALMMTGMDEKKARFQALSAFSGTGFTTKEAEIVVNHPQRRRIITLLMILGNAGIVTIIVAATGTIVTTRGYQISINIFLLILGLYLIYKFATHKKLIRRWESFIENKLVKSAAFEESAVEDLLHLIEGYGLVRAIVTEKSPLVATSLAESQLAEKGTLVLGIERDRVWIPIPKANEPIKTGDRLIVYGALEGLKILLG